MYLELSESEWSPEGDDSGEWGDWWNYGRGWVFSHKVRPYWLGAARLAAGKLHLIKRTQIIRMLVVQLENKKIDVQLLFDKVIHTS